MHFQFPAYTFKTASIGNQTMIFDIIRKKYVTLTPEEWVRQHLIHYLVEEKKYPRSLIAVEMALELNNMKKRCDLVVYGKNTLPLLIAECKAPDVRITQKTFDQIARYNMTLQVKYLLVTNGLEMFVCEIDLEKKSYSFLSEAPEYGKLK